MAPGGKTRAAIREGIYSTSKLKRDLKEHAILKLGYSNESGRLTIELRWRDDKDAYLDPGTVLIEDHLWLNKGLDNE